jgi:ABC-type transport system involved in multi-copper enzyme maturation permease subunit
LFRINPNIIRLTVRRNLFKTVIACAVLFFVSFVLGRFFPNLSEVDAASIAAGWPQLVKDFFGDPFYAFSSSGGWLNIQFYHVVYWIVGGLYVTLLSVMLVAGDVESKRADIILSCPVGRSEIALSGLLAIVLCLPFLIGAAFLGSVAGVAGLGVDYSPRDVFFASIGALPLFLSMAGISILFSVLFFNQLRALVLSWALFGFSFAVEEMLEGLMPAFGKLTALSIFHYYDSADILIRSSFDWSSFFILTLAGLVVAFVGAALFERRDIL